MPTKSRPEPDFYLYTDGSGSNQDRIGASAAIVQHRLTETVKIRTSLSSGSSVRTAEMQALLDGLSLIWDVLNMRDAEVRSQIRMGVYRKPRVAWITDRQELAYTITPVPGQPRYKRNHMPAMWASLAAYEIWFDIDAQWTPRNTIKAQAACDNICSMLRAEMKGILERMKQAGIELI